MSQRMEILVNEELLKDKLTPCRELCPLLLDVFIWRKDVYPCILTGSVTAFFGLLWYLEPSFITALSVLGLCVTVADYSLPLISKSVSNPSDWTSEKEKKFSIFVNRIAYYSVQVWNCQVTLDEWKKERPNVYSSCVVILLLSLAWIGNAVNNLFLMYLLAVVLSLLPGLLHRRIIQQYISKAVLTLSSYFGSKTKQN